MKRIPGGVYPVMITPFTDENTIDWATVDGIVEFYARMGCQGIFAVCQSSEMFCLNEDERVELARRVARIARGRVSQTGVDAVVMISNRLAAKDESDEIAIANMRRILDALPGVTFGMYECPHPYRRPLTDRMLEAMAKTGRFSFIKDTCCDTALIAHRLKVLDGRIQLFNANAATILDSLRDGADGFSGIMANYHPDLYVWLGEHFLEQPEKARKLAAALSVMSAAEAHCHPVDAKYHMDRVGVPMRLHVRNQDESKFGPLDRRFVDDLIILEDAVRQRLAEK